MNSQSFYDSIYQWIHQQLNAKSKRPLVIGVNGPQGIGKSTLTQAMVEALSRDGLNTITISIDDFYYTRAEQSLLAAQNDTNPYQQARGYPGTHDIELGVRTLRELQGRTSKEIKIPRYDKSAHQGRGDRYPEDRWSEVALPLDVVLFEGWMLGFAPVKNSPLENINEELIAYRAWYDFLDAFIILNPQRMEDVIEWRIEAEEKMKASGRTGMSREDIEKYIRSFLPVYQTYHPAMLKHPPVKDSLTIMIGKNHLPVD